MAVATSETILSTRTSWPVKLEFDLFSSPSSFAALKIEQASSMSSPNSNKSYQNDLLTNMTSSVNGEIVHSLTDDTSNMDMYLKQV